MNPTDKEQTLKRYSERFKSHGASPQALGWGKDSKQEFRFGAIREIGIGSNQSVLDVGCGFGDLKQFLKVQGWEGEYLGTELVKEFIEEAKIRDEEISIESIDILEEKPEKQYDFVVSSGIFNHPLKAEDNYNYIAEMLRAMLDISRVGVSADFISTYVDYKEDSIFYSDPVRVFEIAKGLSKRVAIRHDYLPFEYCVYLFKDDSLEEGRNIYKSM